MLCNIPFLIIKLEIHLTARQRDKYHVVKTKFSCLMFYQLDSPNTKKTKTKMLSFCKQQLYFSQIVSKKAKITISFINEKSQKEQYHFGFKFLVVCIWFQFIQRLEHM